MRVPPDSLHDNQPLCSTLANFNNTSLKYEKSIEFHEFCLPYASELINKKREIKCVDNNNYCNDGLSMVPLEVKFC